MSGRRIEYVRWSVMWHRRNKVSRVTWCGRTIPPQLAERMQHEPPRYLLCSKCGSAGD